MWDSFSLFFSTGIPSDVIYSSLGITLVVILVGLLLTCVTDKKRFVFWVILVEYLFIVVCSTIISRPSITCGFDRLELVPFWTYKCVFAHAPGVSVWDIVLNVVLFIPLGFLVKMIYPSLSLVKMLGIAIFFHC